VIREALRDEAETLAAIQRDASLAANAHIFPPELYPFPMGEIIERWESFLDDPAVSVLVCEEDGTAVGVAGARAEWLDGLYVLPEWWSRGVGWHENGNTRVVPFPPHPLDVGYSIEL
jgi:GNAT superfamily N-acetyltransferase